MNNDDIFHARLVTRVVPPVHPLPYGCECGAETVCRVPATAKGRAAFWRAHPTRAGILPLRREAAQRHGGAA